MIGFEQGVPSPKQTLTERQAEVYRQIFLHWAEKGISPSIRELSAAMKMKSPVGCRSHLLRLVCKGWISWNPAMSRSIQLVDVSMSFATCDPTVADTLNSTASCSGQAERQ